MTREDAKDSLFRFMPLGYTMKNINFEIAIDEIFDDLESSVCGNCKHFTKCDDGYNYCDVYSRLNGFVTKDFGCNKFERKDVV